MKYRLADPVINEEQVNLVKEILQSKQLVHGTKCEEFEMKIAEYLCVEHSNVAVTSSCTASLHLVLLAMGFGPNDGVLVPNFTFPATVNAVEVVGATPIFVDVNESDYNMNPNCLEKEIAYWKDKVNLKGIIVVHEFGSPANMDKINRVAKDNNLLLIEDAACAFGTRVGESFAGLISDAGCFSFHPRKALTTGEGGAVVSRNSSLVDQVKILRNHGMRNQQGTIDFIAPGLNYRLTNFQAAIGTVQLTYFDDWINLRYQLQDEYRRRILSDRVTHPVEISGHTWQSYMIVLDDTINRNKLIERLREFSIETNYGAYSVIDTSYYKDKYGNQYVDKLMNSRKLFRAGLCLPLHQTLNRNDINYISECFMTCLEDCGGVNDLE